MEKSKIIEKSVFSLYEKTSNNYRIYLFWENDEESWHIVKTVYGDSEPKTSEMTIPSDILDHMLREKAKGVLNE